MADREQRERMDSTAGSFPLSPRHSHRHHALRAVLSESPLSSDDLLAVQVTI
jgi:hypothetical protein